MPPKLPRGMKLGKNGIYYWRDRRGGAGERWHPLGKELRAAKRKLRELKNGPELPETRITVAEAADKWLQEYVQSKRPNPKGQRIAAYRVERYLARFFPYRPLAGLKRGDLRRYRVWLD